MKYKSILLAVIFLLGVFPAFAQEELPVLRIAHLCDPQLGFGGTDYDGDVARLKTVVRQINELAPDIVVIAGDFVDDVKNDEGVATFKEIIAKIKVPVLLAPGNHDLPDPVTDAGLQRYRSRYGDDFKVVECKGRCIIVANAQMWRQAPEEESTRHERLLLDALENAKTKKQPVLILTHIPPYVTSVDEKDDYHNVPQAKREDILRLFNENGVIFWLAGHTHKTAQRNYQQITLLNGETTSRNFDGHPFGFRLLTIKPDQSFDWDFVACLEQNPGWQLVWEENFDKDGVIDETVWSKIPRGGSDWNRHMSDHEALYDVKDGNLILRGMVNPGLQNDTAPFITGGVYTRDKKGFGRGKIEIRAKLGNAQGAWPAFWLLPFDNTGWPAGGEIDIMERLNSDAIAYQTVHSHYTVKLKQTEPKKGSTGPILKDEYNVYGVELYPDNLVFRINGEKTFTYPRIETELEGQFPFDRPFYLLLDMQLGGAWVGEVNPNDLPVEMSIDWVRFYEWK